MGGGGGLKNAQKFIVVLQFMAKIVAMSQLSQLTR
jgi:hypothetical protein